MAKQSEPGRGRQPNAPRQSVARRQWIASEAGAANAARGARTGRLAGVSIGVPSASGPGQSARLTSRLNANLQTNVQTRPGAGLWAGIHRLVRLCVRGCVNQSARGFVHGWAKSRGWLRSLAARITMRSHSDSASARPLRLVDQCGAGPKLRLLLVEADGYRVLLAASGEQAPTMMLLPASPTRPRTAPTKKRVAASATVSARAALPSAQVGAQVDLPRWPAQPGSEIQ